MVPVKFLSHFSSDDNVSSEQSQCKGKDENNFFSGTKRKDNIHWRPKEKPKHSSETKNIFKPFKYNHEFDNNKNTITNTKHNQANPITSMASRHG